MFPDKIYYEPDALYYKLGAYLKDKYADREWIPIENHNNIEELRKNQNKEFGHMKQHLIIGLRKTHKYVPNHKVSDFLVPYTSSGCSAMCLYCYLVCNYNKCSYLRLFVNREYMMDKLIKTANASNNELTFEIGSNSDLVLENTITGNLCWTIETFAKNGKSYITFPTKFDMVDSILPLEHNGRVIVRMSVNPQEIISRVEFGTSPLTSRINALNKVCDAGYKAGLLIAPVVLTENWKELYSKLIDRLSDELTEKTKKQIKIEIIFMTYSFIHRAINNEAFPKAVELYDKTVMTGRGRGKYTYNPSIRAEAEQYLREKLNEKLGDVPILYIV
jgi:spore photoproduct lyase